MGASGSSLGADGPADVWQQSHGGGRAVGMESNVSTEAAQKNGFRVERGGQYGRPLRRRVEVSGPEFHRLDMDVQAAFAALEDAHGHVPSRGIQEIREHRQWPMRVIARRFRECRDAGVPLQQQLAVVHVLEQWVRNINAAPDSDRDRAA